LLLRAPLSFHARLSVHNIGVAVIISYGLMVGSTKARLAAAEAAVLAAFKAQKASAEATAKIRALIATPKAHGLGGHHLG